MDLEVAAKALKELGHPTRLAIFKRLVKSGHRGLAVGVLQEELGIPNSTLSHHLSSLVSANLLSQDREGRTLYCQPDYGHLQAVVDFLQEECCSDQK
ncbi:metalloregulator ArsR/SmtB family transcription factor [uncultured Microbulbifer sp.]|uniref:ArsR/SmtB family transcription factor n=1 Tax=uncultured Microbulbifer sp. TaxID=348147 RepID=UPI00344E31A3